MVQGSGFRVEGLGLRAPLVLLSSNAVPRMKARYLPETCLPQMFHISLHRTPKHMIISPFDPSFSGLKAITLGIWIFIQTLLGTG